MQISEFIRDNPEYADWDPIELTLALWDKDYADGQMGEPYKDIKFFAEQFGVDVDNTDLSFFERVGKAWEGPIWEPSKKAWIAGYKLKSAEDALTDQQKILEYLPKSAEAVDTLNQYEQRAGVGLGAADSEQQRLLYEDMAASRGTTAEAEEKQRVDDPYWQKSMDEIATVETDKFGREYIDTSKDPTHPYNVATQKLQEDLTSAQIGVADVNIEQYESMPSWAKYKDIIPSLDPDLISPRIPTGPASALPIKPLKMSTAYDLFHHSLPTMTLAITAGITTALATRNLPATVRNVAMITSTGFGFGTPIWLEMYNREDPRLPQEERRENAFWNTSFEVIPELLPYVAFFRPFKNVLMRGFLVTGAEGFSESLTEFLYIFREEKKKDPTASYGEIAKRVMKRYPEMAFAFKTGLAIATPLTVGGVSIVGSKQAYDKWVDIKSELEGAARPGFDASGAPIVSGVETTGEVGL